MTKEVKSTATEQPPHKAVSWYYIDNIRVDTIFTVFDSVTNRMRIVGTSGKDTLWSAESWAKYTQTDSGVTYQTNFVNAGKL